jgi:hypothetical protein
VESEFASYLLQVVREGGAAAGGALLVLVIVSWFGVTGRIVPRSMYIDMRSQRDRALREAREERRAHRNTVQSYRSAVLPQTKEG